MNLQMTSKIAAVTAATALALGLAACGGDDDAVDYGSAQETTTAAEIPGTVPGQTESPLTEEAALAIYEAYDETLTSPDSTQEDFDRFASLDIDFETIRDNLVASNNFLSVIETDNPRVTSLMGEDAILTFDKVDNSDPTNPAQTNCTQEVTYYNDSATDTHWKIDEILNKDCI